MRGLKPLSHFKDILKAQSHLLQMRGLKQGGRPIQNQQKVASFTDAWIETVQQWRAFGVYQSHLLQMRGLKPNRNLYYKNYLRVASFTDAWIETLEYLLLPSHPTVASFTDAWIETPLHPVFAGVGLSHLLQMRGLKHNFFGFV